jgi:RNA polymerase primary sigma factor
MATVKDRSTNKAMRLYLKEISKIPLLTAEEEKELGNRVKRGDKEAVQKLVESNLRFVITIAKKFRPSGLPFLDLINEGNVGLIKAASRFDPDMNVRFTSYAVWWIRQSILFYLSESAHAFRLSPKLSNILYRVAKVTAKARADQSEMPSRESLAQVVGVSVKQLNRAIDAGAGVLQLDQPIDENGELKLKDTLEQTTFHSAESETITAHLKAQLNAALLILSETEQQVVRLRFGLDDGDPQTLNEIGVKMKRSRERIRQIEGHALTKLKRSIAGSALSSYLQ